MMGKYEEVTISEKNKVMSHEQIRALLEKNDKSSSMAFDPFFDIELPKDVKSVVIGKSGCGLGFFKKLEEINLYF